MYPRSAPPPPPPLPFWQPLSDGMAGCEGLMRGTRQIIWLVVTNTLDKCQLGHAGSSHFDSWL